MAITLFTAALCLMALEVSNSFTLKSKGSTVCDVFEKTAGYALYGHNEKPLYETSLEECKTACIELGPDCLSFDYNSNTDSCFLSSESKDTKPESFGKHGQASYYHKVCHEVIEGDDENDIEIGDGGSEQGSGAETDDCVETYGPFGGSGGWQFNEENMMAADGFRIHYSADIIFCFGLIRDGDDFKSCHGGDGPVSETITFAEGEFITGVKGREGDLIDQLTIITNQNTYGPYGGTGGTPFEATPANKKLAYISGRSGELLDQIQFHFYCSSEF